MVPAEVMVAGLVGAGVAVLFVLLVALGVFDRQRTETLEERIAAYTKAGTARAAAGTPGVRLAQPARPEGIAASAVDIAEKALTSSRGLEATLSARLEAAAVALKPAEWLLAHAGIAFGAGLVGLLVSSGSILVTLLLLVLGAVLPWVYLGMKRSRRLKAFNGQLAETLQLMAGSLSAGLSLAQSIDTVVREGTEPVSGEFRRALVEARLGVSIEDALDSVAKRMDSQDFEWVVMAIKIQREVGGNLAELLLGVAATMRERDYLRRQVKTLSAEGRLSAWILGGLPPGFVAYLSVANPSYLEPMFSSPIGWMMLGVAATMLAVGIFWMSKMVKVEV